MAKILNLKWHLLSLYHGDCDKGYSCQRRISQWLFSFRTLSHDSFAMLGMAQISQLWFLSLWNEFHYLLHRNICCVNHRYLGNAEGGRDFAAWKGQKGACPWQGYAQCSQVCMYKTLPGSQLRTEIPLFICKCADVPPCDILVKATASQESISDSSGNALCYASHRAAHFLKELFPKTVLSVLAVISHLQHVCSRGNTCLPLWHSGPKTLVCCQFIV